MLCDFSSAFLLNAVGEFALLGVIIYYTLVDLPRSRPSARRRRVPFLACAGLFCICRGVYFMAWIALYNGPGCPPPSNSANESPDPIWMSVFGTLPSPLFVTAFSFNVVTFAHIFHWHSEQQISLYEYFVRFLWAVNIAMYASFVGLLIPWPNDKVSIYLDFVNFTITFIGQFVIGFFLCAYAYLLYRNYPEVMYRLWIACLVCFICMLFKCVIILLLALLYSSNYTPLMISLYTFVAETIPLGIMLLIEFVGGRLTDAEKSVSGVDNIQEGMLGDRHTSTSNYYNFTYPGSMSTRLDQDRYDFEY